MKYDTMAKDKLYTFFIDGLMYMGHYQYRFFDKKLSKWHYCFRMGVDLGHRMTVETDRVQVFHKG